MCTRTHTHYLSYFVCRAAQINRYAALSFMAASLTVGTLPLLYVPPTPSKPPHLQSTRYVVRSQTAVAQWFSSVPHGRRVMNVRRTNSHADSRGRGNSITYIRYIYMFMYLRMYVSNVEFECLHIGVAGSGRRSVKSQTVFDNESPPPLFRSVKLKNSVTCGCSPSIEPRTRPALSP